MVRWLSRTGEHSGTYKIEPGGVYTVMDPTQERTYKFLDKFVDEMGKLFPDAYFHIGGDEVNGKPWDDNPKIQAFMHSHGFENKQDLQGFRMEERRVGEKGR